MRWKRYLFTERLLPEKTLPIGKKKFNDFYRKEIANKYNLGTTINIKRIITALQKREIITIAGKNICIEDPIFEKWLKINLN